MLTLGYSTNVYILSNRNSNNETYENNRIFYTTLLSKRNLDFDRMKKSGTRFQLSFILINAKAVLIVIMLQILLLLHEEIMHQESTINLKSH